MLKCGNCPPDLLDDECNYCNGTGYREDIKTMPYRSDENSLRRRIEDLEKENRKLKKNNAKNKKTSMFNRVLDWFLFEDSYNFIWIPFTVGLVLITFIFSFCRTNSTHVDEIQTEITNYCESTGYKLPGDCSFKFCTGLITSSSSTEKFMCYVKYVKDPEFTVRLYYSKPWYMSEKTYISIAPFAINLDKIDYNFVKSSWGE